MCISTEYFVTQNRLITSKYAIQGDSSLPCKNILQTACEARNTEIVEYLIDEIMNARKSCLGEGFHNSSENIGKVISVMVFFHCWSKLVIKTVIDFNC